MNKIFENANEQHVRSVKLYFNDSDSILYLDSEKKTAIEKEDLQRLFIIGVISIVDNNEEYRPIRLTDNYVSYLKNNREVKAYAAGAIVDNPILSVSAESDTPILGKNVSEFQSNIQIKDNKVTGTLNYIEGFTEFNGSDPTEQEGNYLFLNFKDTVADKIECKLVGGKSGKFIDCTSDKWMLYWITEACTAVIVKLTKGKNVIEKTLNISDLTLTPRE